MEENKIVNQNHIHFSERLRRRKTSSNGALSSIKCHAEIIFNDASRKGFPQLDN